jgi:hypothetical protein
MDAQPLARIRLKTKSAPDRRGGQRDRRMLEATVKYQGQFHHLEVHNLSETGAYAVAPFTPMLADSLTLNIDMPHLGGSVMISGRVRRIGLSSRALQRQGGFGIEFTRFYSPAGRQCLSAHLAD